MTQWCLKESTTETFTRLLSLGKTKYLSECHHEWLKGYNTADATISHRLSVKH